MTALYGGYVGSLSWFDNKSTLPDDFEGESGKAFFGGGDGTSASPYQIKNARHFYNLCWLQYLGRFNKDTDSDGVIDQVYFELTNDIDCSSLGSALPPIGTTRYPFVGNFNGNDHIVKNYTITDKYSELKKHPSIIDTEDTYYTQGANTINYCSIIGTFGVIGYNTTGATDVTTDEATLYNNFSTSQLKVNSVDNLYIDKVTIKPATKNTLAGLLAGYVSANMSGCGVHYSNLNFSNGNTNISSKFNNKLSNYTLIGDYNSTDYDWDGHEGGDTGYGTSTDIRQLYYDLGGSDSTSSIEVAGKQALPFRADLNDESIKEPSQKKATVNIKETETGSVNLASNQQAAKNNIGYYVGNSVKAFRDSSVKSLTITKPSYYYNYFSTDVPDEVTSFLNKETTDKSGNASYNYQYSIFISDSTSNPLSEGYNKADNLNLVENAIVNDFTSCSSYKDSQGKLLLVPNRCIWVAPKQAGKFKMVVYNTENDTMCQLVIYRLIRSTPKDYSTYFTSATKFLIAKGVETSGIDANITIPKSNSKTALQAYYYTFDVSDADVQAGYEFAITQNTGKPYIAYLDIGNNGGGSEEDTKEGKLENIDFYYYKDNALVKVSSDNKSDVVFDISGDGSAVFYFNRILNIGVLYYDENVNSLTRTQPSTFTGTSVQASDNTCTASN